MEYGFQNFMVPRKGLEPLHLAATASKTVMSTIPSPGHFFWIFNFSSCTPFMCRTVSRMLAFRSMAPYGRTSTIPSPGHFFWIFNFSSCTPLECRPALRRLLLGSMAPMCRLFHRLASPHIYHSITWANMSGARDGTWTHTPEGIRIWNVRVYHSTTRAYFNWFSRVVRVPLSTSSREYGSRILAFARFEPHIYHSTTRASNDSIEKSK